jgi:L-ascorbate metabolism protein UlaG (beta-lactamase superfamily)
MKIKWNGHACFTITASDGTTIVTDPYEPGAFDGAVAYGPVDDRADVALVSHDHADHNYVQGLSGKPQVLTGPGSAKGVEFAAVEAAHDEKQGAERGKNTLFAFEVDGVRVGFMGDLGHLLSEEQLAALGRIDVLLLPTGGVFTVGPEEAKRLVDQIKPKLVIPMHYKTPECGFPLAGVDDFAGQLASVKEVGSSEVEISAAALPSAGPELWILAHAR